MMRTMHLSELCAPLQARLVGEDAEFDAVSTDSRSVPAGALFVALCGEEGESKQQINDFELELPKYKQPICLLKDRDQKGFFDHNYQLFFE